MPHATRSGGATLAAALSAGLSLVFLSFVCFGGVSFAHAEAASEIYTSVSANAKATRQPAPGAVSSPGAFVDDYTAAMAAGGGSLWLVKTGSDRKKNVRIQTLRYRNGRWRALPRRPRTTNDTAPVLVLYRAPGRKRAGPCVGDTTPRGAPRVRCLEGRRWRSKSIPKQWSSRAAWIAGLTVRRGRLHLLMQHRTRRSKDTIRVFRLHGSRFKPFGHSIKSKVQVLAEPVSEAPGARGHVSVGLIGTATPPFRQVFTLKKGRWLRSPRMPRMEEGSASRGLVRVGRRTFFPVNQAESDQFQFSVWVGEMAGPGMRSAASC